MEEFQVFLTGLLLDASHCYGRLTLAHLVYVHNYLHHYLVAGEATLAGELWLRQ